MSDQNQNQGPSVTVFNGPPPPQPATQNYPPVDPNPIMQFEGKVVNQTLTPQPAPQMGGVTYPHQVQRAPTVDTSYRAVPFYNNMWLREIGTNRVVAYNENLAAQTHRFELLPDNKTRDKIVQAQKGDGEYRRALRAAEINRYSNISNVYADPQQQANLMHAQQMAAQNQVIQPQPGPAHSTNASIQPRPAVNPQPVPPEKQADLPQQNAQMNAQMNAQVALPNTPIEATAAPTPSTLNLNQESKGVKKISQMKAGEMKAELIEKHGWNPPPGTKLLALKKHVQSFRKTGRAFVEAPEE